MKKYVLMAAMMMTLAAPVAAWSQTALPPGGNGNGPAPQNQGGQQEDAQHFQARKAEILQRMNAHLAETQQRINCVQAASNHEALRACMPRDGEGHGGMHHGPGGQQGGPGGEGPGDGQGGER